MLGSMYGKWVEEKVFLCCLTITLSIRASKMEHLQHKVRVESERNLSACQKISHRRTNLRKMEYFTPHMCYAYVCLYGK